LLFCICIGLFQATRLSSAEEESTVSSEEAGLVERNKYMNEFNLRAQLPRLGFDNIHANAAFISFLQYFGDEAMREQNGYGLSSRFFESIIPNDPYYTEFYVFLTNSVSLYAAQPERSAELMNKGITALTKNRVEDSFYVWRYKGVDELLFLNDAESARHSFEKAAEWASESSLPEGELIASISQQTADFLAQNPDSKAAQIGAWSSVLTTAVGDETRNRAIDAIQALGGEVSIDENGGVSVQYAQDEQDIES